jgi:hypothetical protein
VMPIEYRQLIASILSGKAGVLCGMPSSI